MKKYIIRIAKKNELLYRMAKRFYRSVRPAAPTLYQNYDYVIAYRAKEEQQLSTIFAHYAQIKKGNTRLLIFWEGEPLLLHRLMREHPSTYFLSVDYYARYHQKLRVRNFILLDMHQEAPSILEFI